MVTGLQRSQRHLVHRIGWLRASVLGANDGIISTSRLVVGIAAAATSSSTVLLTGIAALVAGAISMAAGEYVSVSSQADVEGADRRREEREHADELDQEREELAALYRERGVAPDLARKVAEQLMARDAVGAHMRDELGISEGLAARPVQAALASAAAFCAGAIIPVLMVPFIPRAQLVLAVTVVSLVLLALLGAIGARAGGASPARGAVRVVFWGALAMAATAAIGALFGAQV
ncbi:MAG: VIT family protein [Hyphomicrobium sp.]|nr:VIT family protein [Hyphomicrobium sp.]